MKKILVIIAVFAAVAALCGCNENKNTVDDTQTKPDIPVWSESSGKIVVGLPADNEPMSFTKENSTELKGFCVDLINACADKMGVTAEYNLMKHENRHIYVNSSNADIIFTSPDDDVTKMIFTKPILKNDQILISKPGSNISKAEDLNGKTVASRKWSTAIDDFIAKHPDVKIADSPVYENNLISLENLLNGNVDSMITDETFIQYYIRNNEFDISILPEKCKSDYYVIAASEGNKELIDRLQAAIDECIEDGTAHSITSKWFGDDLMLGSNDTE